MLPVGGSRVRDLVGNLRRARGLPVESSQAQVTVTAVRMTPRSFLHYERLFPNSAVEFPEWLLLTLVISILLTIPIALFALSVHMFE